MNREVIIACDFNSETELNEFLINFESLSEKPFLKIGMELFYSTGIDYVSKLRNAGFKIFLDLKLHDIPNTVGRTVLALAKSNANIINVHAAGGKKMMEAARLAADNWREIPKVIAVTQLTSTSKEVMNKELQIGGEVKDSVDKFAKLAKEAKMDGIVCSAFEAKQAETNGLMSITPGIRLNKSNSQDQVRVATPSEAKDLGSTFIVVGRSITQAENILEAYNKCVEGFK